MRIPDKITMAVAMQGQARTSERLLASTRAASSGRKVQAPADDPVAYVAGARHEARLMTLQGRRRSADRTAGDLETSENALSEAGDLIAEARALAVEGANGVHTSAARATMARQVSSLRESLIALANTRGTRGYLFAGTRTDTAPFTSTGTFVGNDGVTEVSVGDGAPVAGNVSGARAFTAAGGRDVIADLAALATALSTDNLTGIRSAIDVMDADRQQLLHVRLDAGLGAERLRTASEVLQNASVVVEAAHATEVEADAADVYSQLAATKSAYERALSVTRQILSINTFSGS